MDQINVKAALLYHIINHFIQIYLLNDSKTQAIKKIMCKYLKTFYSLKLVSKL